jgi:hypothetical protein
MRHYKLTLWVESVDPLGVGDRADIFEWLKTMPINGYMSAQHLEEIDLSDVKVQGTWNHL